MKIGWISRRAIIVDSVFEPLIQQAEKITIKLRQCVFGRSVVVIDDWFPFDSTRKCFLGVSSLAQTWVRFMGKAYAKFEGSWDLIGQGGFPEDALSDLTGLSHSYYELLRRKRIHPKGQYSFRDTVQCPSRSSLGISETAFCRKKSHRGVLVSETGEDYGNRGRARVFRIWNGPEVPLFVGGLSDFDTDNRIFPRG